MNIILKNRILPIFTIILFFSCNDNRAQLSESEIEQCKNSVTLLAINIEKDITNKGPVAWLTYFENSPGFFMASDGNLVFKNYPSAKTFILNTLVKAIPHIKLKWDNLRVSLLSANLASIGAGFHEELTDSAWKTIFITGYFTGTAHKTNNGWKLLNAHWSIKPTDKTSQ